MTKNNKKSLFKTIVPAVFVVVVFLMIAINGGREIIDGNRFAAAQEEKVSFEFDYPNNYSVSVTKNVGTLTADEKYCLLSFWNSKAEDTNKPVFPTQDQELIIPLEAYLFLQKYTAETRTFCVPDSAYFPNGPWTDDHYYWLNEAEKRCVLAVSATEKHEIIIHDNSLKLSNTLLRTLMSLRQFYNHEDDQVPESNQCVGI